VCISASSANMGHARKDGESSQTLCCSVYCSVQRLATGWTVRGSNRSGGENFRTYSDRLLGKSSLLYNGYRVFPGGKERPGREAETSAPSTSVAKKKENYTSTPLWAIRPVESLSASTKVHFTFTYTSNPPMDRTASTEPQCLYNDALYLYLYL